MKSRAREIQQYILTHIAKHPGDIATRICKKFSVTRMTATRQLQALIAQEKIIKSGNTSNTQYYLATAKNKQLTFPLNQEFDEFRVFKKYIEPALIGLPENQSSIFYYCCTELMNNAKDHSHGLHLYLKIKKTSAGIVIEIMDDGVGIFKKLQHALKLPNLKESVLMLSKGKVTTDPSNHTGEGVFFSSRAVDQLQIEANGIQYIKDNTVDDWFCATSHLKKGTKITVWISKHCARVLKNVFLAYMNPDDHRFEKTEILVELAKQGDEIYIARSQAKRILVGLEKFSRIILDFRNVETVGQGFVDEVFRVFQNQYPHITIDYCNANEDVTFMIKRGLANKS